MARREKIVRYWYRRVTPIDRVAVEGGALCFTDLAVSHRMARPARAVYRISSFGGDGAPLPWRTEVRPDEEGRACAAGVQAGPGRDGYLIAKLVPSRPGASMRPVEVHLARNPAGALRVIGLHRW